MTTASPIEPKWRNLADNPTAVLALIFLVSGCLGIPVILICRRFSPLQKVFWIVISIIYTVSLIALVVAFWMWWVWPRIAPVIYP